MMNLNCWVFFIIGVMIGICPLTAEESGINEKGNTMNPKVLIIYGTRAGSTAEVADSIAAILKSHDVTVELREAKQVKSVKGYSLVIIGSAIRLGKVLPEIQSLVEKHQEDLSKTATAFFVVCMTLKDNTPENRKIANGFLDPLRKLVTPVEAGLFAGKMDYSKLGFLARFACKYMVKVPEGDFRDWPVIRAWTNGLAGRIKSGAPEQAANLVRQAS